MEPEISIEEAKNVIMRYGTDVDNYISQNIKVVDNYDNSVELGSYFAECLSIIVDLGISRALEYGKAKLLIVEKPDVEVKECVWKRNETPFGYEFVTDCGHIANYKSITHRLDKNECVIEKDSRYCNYCGKFIKESIGLPIKVEGVK